MTKQEFLIAELGKKAISVGIRFKDSDPQQRSEMLIEFMSIQHLCGQEELIAPVTAKECDAWIERVQNQLLEDYEKQL